MCPFFAHKEYLQRRFSLGSFPSRRHTAGISAHLLLSTSEEWSCQVCTTLLISVELWFHLLFFQKPHLLFCVSLWSLPPELCLWCQCSSVCSCSVMQIEIQLLKSNSFPLYPWLFLAGSVPDPIHCTDTQTAVSVWQEENVWGKQRIGLAEFNHHWYQMGNHNHEWLL